MRSQAIAVRPAGKGAVCCYVSGVEGRCVGEGREGIDLEVEFDVRVLDQADEVGEL